MDYTECEVMSFDQHAFISYAHIDNQPLTPDQKGWVSQFHATLQTMLSQRLGAHAKIWRDNKLTGNDVFSAEIVGQFPKTALLISVLTPRYLKSEWCTREVQEFCSTALRNGGVTVDNKSRIFKVIKTPVDTQDALPNVMQQSLGYEFFDFDEGEPRELDPAFGEKPRQEFLRKVNKLSWDVAQLVKRLSADGAPAGKVIEAAAPAKLSVYLAECGRDKRVAREMLEAELKSHGYTVLPARQLPLDEGELLSEVRSQLAQCALSVHLVGSSYGLIPDGPTQRSVVEQQNQLAAERSRQAGLRRMIWIPEKTQGEHTRQQEFIKALHLDVQAQYGADLLTCDLESFKGAMRATLRQLEQRPAAAAVGANAAGAKIIHLLMDKDDRKASVPLIKLLKARGFAVTLPVFVGEATLMREANEQLIEHCDALLLFYGAGDEAWRFHQQNDVKKLRALQQCKAAALEYIYLSAPEGPDKELMISLEEPNLIDALGGLTEAALLPLFAALEAH
jgi:hypothetical protein